MLELNKRELVQYFETIDFHPSHRLGQNFLIDRNLAHKLVDLAVLRPGERVVEIGPGMGMISREILAKGAELMAVEKDQRLLRYLQSNFGDEFGDRFHVVEGDALQLPLAGADEVENLSVIANPPFAITGPWLAAMLDLGFPKTVALLLQKEAVDRITAREGNKHFGVLAIRLEAAYQKKGVHSVPPQSFYPAPKIESKIVVFQRREILSAFDEEFLGIVQQLFMQRRKQIGGKLKKILSSTLFDKWSEQLSKNGFTMQSRPEQIPTEVWVELKSLDR